MCFRILGAFPALVYAVVNGGPEQFHVAVTNTPGDFVVTYITKDTGAASSTCEVKGLGTFKGSTRTYTDGGWQGVIHAVTLKGLEASTMYGYTCEGVARELRTPPPADALPLRLAAVADLGEACNKPGCGNATIKALADASKAGAFDLMLHAGDIAYTSGDQDIWDEFMREMDPSASRMPYMVCVGNHEHYYNFTGYLNRFDMPGPHVADPARRNLWGSFDVGGVHFVYVSTEHVGRKRGVPDFADEQVAFLRADLAKAASKAQREKVPWIVASGHRPLYCSTRDPYDCGISSAHLRELFEPMFKEFGVDIYLTGHLHNYERTWPVFNGTVEKKSYTNVKDTVHAVIGSAGDNEGLTDFWEQCPDWSAFQEGKHVGYAELLFSNASVLTFSYRNAATGTVMDSFTLTKDRAQLPDQFVV